MITSSTHQRILGELKTEIDRHIREAESQAEAEIIVLARRFGLRPGFAGPSPSAWYADCPGKFPPLDGQQQRQ
ncbi:hypothetical protein HOP62_09055 [Halomonas sp. MCCC 1A17488]|uniref:hypothetical protein n=1 Tax=unclassified Halomonas TaxID=2609666 RepID=UPI0018D20E1B|nr:MULTISPECIES: hypothetical protein [unclassified Halomonas]MCE8016225.1 hypothetical protein [Halomonas sp. MCCC 1A17488]MCG3239558.1 hypothetical protein [Halomonas sp. MCCC 1A17488]QPP50523.1 hypothetical protein I4484_05325 [Halomonas sp. SS10-MC5]